MAHITKYGNTYTDQEWAEMQAGFKAQEEADNAIEAKIDGMIKYLIRQCIKFGFSEEQAQTIARLFRTAEYLEAEIQFSSPERQAFVEDMWARFDKAMSKLN
jgi:hypothetical protein